MKNFKEHVITNQMTKQQDVAHNLSITSSCKSAPFQV